MRRHRTTARGILFLLIAWERATDECGHIAGGIDDPVDLALSVLRLVESGVVERIKLPGTRKTQAAAVRHTRPREIRMSTVIVSSSVPEADPDRDGESRQIDGVEAFERIG